MARRSALLRLLIRLIGPVVLVVVVWRLDDKEALWRSVWNASWPLLAGAVATAALSTGATRAAAASTSGYFAAGLAALAVLAFAVLARVPPAESGSGAPAADDGAEAGASRELVPLLVDGERGAV